MKAVKVSQSSVLWNQLGVFKHSDWIGMPFGSKEFSNKGGFVYLLAPTPELWSLVLSHRTQILYIADISFVVMYLEIVPGCLVLESETGSGSLKHHLPGLQDMYIYLISMSKGLPQLGRILRGQE